MQEIPDKKKNCLRYFLKDEPKFTEIIHIDA